MSTHWRKSRVRGGFWASGTARGLEKRVKWAKKGPPAWAAPSKEMKTGRFSPVLFSDGASQALNGLYQGLDGSSQSWDGPSETWNGPLILHTGPPKPAKCLFSLNVDNKTVHYFIVLIQNGTLDKRGGNFIHFSSQTAPLLQAKRQRDSAFDWWHCSTLRELWGYASRLSTCHPSRNGPEFYAGTLASRVGRIWSKLQ